MNKIESFQNFLVNKSPVVAWDTFTINIILAAIMSYLLSVIYVRYGYSLSNRKIFSRNFVLLTTTTMLVIAIVKSSLALSLGLVGALSIVRFRAAIKEPEELAYLFICIAIGLGFGADQRLITLIAFCVITIIVSVRKRYRSGDDHENLFLTISHVKDNKLTVDEIVKTIKDDSEFLQLKRLDENKELLEMTFSVHYKNFECFTKSKENLQQLDPQLKINYIDSRGLQ